MTAKQYRQQLTAKWSAIQDQDTKNLIAQLLDYAQNLENANAQLKDPKNPNYPVSPRGDDENTQNFRASIDFSRLSDTAADEVGPLVENLLQYAEGLEHPLP